MKYFVTGATGFIGGRLVTQLLEAGHSVVTLARNPDKAGDLKSKGVEVHKGDITDKESLRKPMTGVDGIFHLAAWYKVGVKDNTEAYNINVNGTRNVLEMMKELNIPRGVYTSTLAAFGDTHGKLVDESFRHDGPWNSHYDHTKWQAHFEVALPMIKAGLPLIIVQPGVVYGPGDTSTMHDLFVQYLQGKLPMSPQRTKLCWAHVDDTARGHALAMEKGKIGESYIIAGPALELKEALELSEKITGKKAPTIHPSPAILKGLSGVLGVVGKVVTLPDMMSAEGLRTIAGTTYIGDNAKAKRELGFAPRSIEDGLRETLNYEMEKLGMVAKK